MEVYRMGLKRVRYVTIIVLIFTAMFIAGCGKEDSSTKIGEIVDADYILTLSVATYRDGEFVQEIINIDTASGESTLIASDKGTYAAPVWSPDGAQLAYSSGTGLEGEKQCIRIIDGSGNELKVIPDLGGDETVVGWSKDGKKLLVQGFMQDEIYYTMFYIVDINSGEAELVGDFREDSFESIQYAEWSPDEKYVIFSAANDEGMSSIYKLDVSDGSLAVMTQGYYDDIPKWSPDGKHIMFTRLREERVGNNDIDEEYNPSIDIWITDVDGNEFKCIANEELTDHLDAVWSPDGKSIVFLRSPKNADGQNELVLYSIESGEEKVLTTGGEYKYIPTISPDGKKVAFASFDDNNMEEMPEQGFDSHVYVLDIEKGKQKKLSTFTGDIYTLEWGGVESVD